MKEYSGLEYDNRISERGAGKATTRRNKQSTTAFEKKESSASRPEPTQDDIDLEEWLEECLLNQFD